MGIDEIQSAVIFISTKSGYHILCSYDYHVHNNSAAETITGLGLFTRVYYIEDSTSDITVFSWCAELCKLLSKSNAFWSE